MRVALRSYTPRATLARSYLPVWRMTFAFARIDWALNPKPIDEPIGPPVITRAV